MPFGVEFELLRHLDAHGIPVARPRAFDDSGRILPQAYVVLDFVPGTTRFTTDDPGGMAVEMADVLAAIHDLDATSASLPGLPLHVDRMQGWVITDLTRREPDPSLREDLVRRHLDEHWPPPATELCLLHADYFPGNIVWEGDEIAAVIDWESAALGDPMADIATTRLDLRWAYGAEVAERFTDRYLSPTGRSTETLAVWELVVSLRPPEQCRCGPATWWRTDGPTSPPNPCASSSTPTSTTHSNASTPPRISIRDAHKTGDRAISAHPLVHLSARRRGELKGGSKRNRATAVLVQMRRSGTRQRG